MYLNGKGKYNPNKIVIHAAWCGGHGGGRGCLPRDHNKPESGLCEHHEVQPVHVQGPAPGSVFKGLGLQLDLILRVFF